MWFRHTIKKNNIQNFVKYNEWDKSDIVQKIQNMKENTVDRLIKSFSQENIKFIDPMLIKWIEKEYFELLKNYDWNINNNFDYTKQQKEIEKMFKIHSFDDAYLSKFKKHHDNKLLDIHIRTLLDRRKDLLKKSSKWPRDYDELKKINKALSLMNTNNIKNTKSRNVLFDKELFEQSENYSDKFNIQCFYEQDKQWNKNYFSVNELLNDLETFWVESWYPKLKLESLWNHDKEFKVVQKFIKLALVKNILAKYRDYQEVVIYNFKDYEKLEWWEWHKNQEWVLAEQIVERSFRDYANLDDRHEVKIKKASIWEDQAHKVDLILQVKDKKTWINIEKELQLTVNSKDNVLQNKKIQIKRQKEIRHTDLDLVKLELNWLAQKATVWRNSDRPIWGLNSLLSIEDKEFLKHTYDRIIENLDKKVSIKDKTKINWYKKVA